MNMTPERRQALVDSIVASATTVANLNPDNIDVLGEGDLTNLACSLQIVANDLIGKRTDELISQWLQAHNRLVLSDAETEEGARLHALEQAYWDTLYAHLYRRGMFDVLDNLKRTRIAVEERV